MALALCLGLAFSMTACVAENRTFVPSGGQLVVDVGSESDATTPAEVTEAQELTLTYYPKRSTNPFTCTDYTNRTLFSLIYQGLFSVSKDYEAVPMLCGRYEVSQDNMTYTIHLTQGATFSDGSAVTIEDVMASYAAAKKSAYYGGRFVHIVNFYAEGSAIIFQLDTPMEDLLILLDIPIVPAEQVDVEAPLGSGAYSLHSTITSGYLRRVGNWWCKDTADLVVTASSIPLEPAESASQIRDQFEFYDLDLACANPCSNQYADFRCDYELWDCENGEMLYLACNVTYRDFFSTPTLRSLLTYGIDREGLSEKYFRSFARAVTLPASTYFPEYNTGLASKYEYNPERFKELLASAPYPGRDLVMLVNSDDTLRLQTARDIAATLTSLGLPVTVVGLNTDDFLNRIYAGNYDLYLGSTRLSPNMDLSPFFQGNGSLSYNGIANSNLYQLCLEALENHGNYYSLYQEVAEDGRIVPVLFCGYAVYATRGVLSDLQPARDNVFYYTLGRTLEDAMVAFNYS